MVSPSGDGAVQIKRMLVELPNLGLVGAKPTIERTLDHTNHKQINIPLIVKFPEALDGLLFLTVQLYSPTFLPCTVKVL